MKYQVRFLIKDEKIDGIVDADAVELVDFQTIQFIKDRRAVAAFKDWCFYAEYNPAEQVPAPNPVTIEQPAICPCPASSP